MKAYLIYEKLPYADSEKQEYWLTYSSALEDYNKKIAMCKEKRLVNYWNLVEVELKD